MSKSIVASEEIVDINGARLWTSRQGNGPPLALLHGGPGIWDYFDELAVMIDDLVEVCRYDQRGSGRSDGGPPYDVATFVADLDALRVHWGHERWILAGHSWGAGLALAYAVQHPKRVQALIYLDGTGVIEDWHDEYHANADARRTSAQQSRRLELRAIVKEGGELTLEQDQEYCVLTWMADYADGNRAREFARKLLRPYGPNYAVNDLVGADWKRLLADGEFVERVYHIDAPVLVLHGSEDPRPVRLAERFASSLPNAELVFIPGAGHIPWLERPEPVRAALQQFLARVTQPAVARASP